MHDGECLGLVRVLNNLGPEIFFKRVMLVNIAAKINRLFMHDFPLPLSILNQSNKIFFMQLLGIMGQREIEVHFALFVHGPD